MNYKKAYSRLVNKAKSQNREKSVENYFERHHIVPKCFGGKNNPMYGKTHTEEVKELIRKTKLGKKILQSQNQIEEEKG